MTTILESTLHNLCTSTAAD